MPSDVKSWQRDALPQDTMLHGYRVKRIIGRGGFGITYAVVDAIDQLFAMKECYPRQFACREGIAVHPTGNEDEAPFRDCLSRFVREAKSLVLLSTMGAKAEGIVKVVTLFETNGTAYLVMELLSGQTLAELIGTHPSGLPSAQVRGLMLGVLRALGAVHGADLLHRDIKPANIFLRDNGAPVLIDFGAARTTAHGQTMTFTQIYSEGYAPIEQMVGDPQDPSADLYAFGATFYRIIGGKLEDALSRYRKIQTGEPDPVIPAATWGAGRYDPAILRTIDACLRPTAKQRPQTVEAALLLMAGDETIVSMPAMPRPPASDAPGEEATVVARQRPETRKARIGRSTGPSRDRRIPLMLIGGGLFLCTAVALAFFWPRNGEHPQPAMLEMPAPPKTDTARQKDDAEPLKSGKSQKDGDESGKIEANIHREPLPEEKQPAAVVTLAVPPAAALSPEPASPAVVLPEQPAPATLAVPSTPAPESPESRAAKAKSNRPHDKPKPSPPIKEAAETRSYAEPDTASSGRCHDLREKFAIGGDLSEADLQFLRTHCR